MKDLMWRATWGPGDWGALIVFLALAFWWATPWIFPASQFITLELVRVSDGVEGEPLSKIEVVAHRTIHRDAENARYEVGIRAAQSGGAECYAKRSRPYAVPRQSGPLRRDLAWWAYSEDGECVNWKPDPGQYIVRTRHCWKRYDWVREACNPWTYSNVFTIRPE